MISERWQENAHFQTRQKAKRPIESSHCLRPRALCYTPGGAVAHRVVFASGYGKQCYETVRSAIWGIELDSGYALQQGAARWDKILFRSSI